MTFRKGFQHYFISLNLLYVPCFYTIRNNCVKGCSE